MLRACSCDRGGGHEDGADSKEDDDDHGRRTGAGGREKKVRTEVINEIAIEETKIAEGKDDEGDKELEAVPGPEGVEPPEDLDDLDFSTDPELLNNKEDMIEEVEVIEDYLEVLEEVVKKEGWDQYGVEEAAILEGDATGQEAVKIEYLKALMERTKEATIADWIEFGRGGERDCHCNKEEEEEGEAVKDDNDESVFAEEGDASSSAEGNGDKDPSDDADDANGKGPTSAKEEEAFREGGKEEDEDGTEMTEDPLDEVFEEIKTVAEEIVKGEGEMFPADSTGGGEEGEEGDEPPDPAKEGRMRTRRMGRRVTRTGYNFVCVGARPMRP